MNRENHKEKGREILTEAINCWEKNASFRKNRNRCRDYNFGRQWNDVIEAYGTKMTEYEYIVGEGSIPFTNNLIRRIVRNVLGVFRKRLAERLSGLCEEQKRLFNENRMTELYSRTMEEFLVSGMAVHRKWIGIRNDKPGIWTEMVNPSSFFFNSEACDVRGWDISLAGVLHEVGFSQWCREFVRTPEEFEKARNYFGYAGEKKRIMEVWRREKRLRTLCHFPEKGTLTIEEEFSTAQPRRRKRFLDDVWRYYFINENGDVLREGDSPYIHGRHPFIFRCYPFFDGEIHSFVADIIDQQRYTNRLITLYDWVIRASAKGVLLLPEGTVSPENYQCVADQWSRFNGVITYKAKPGVPEPRQVSGNTSNLGISDLLDIQLKMIEDVSGVNATLQGNLAGNSVSGTLYNQQTENAMTSLVDLMESFDSFITDCLEMESRLLLQVNS